MRGFLDPPSPFAPTKSLQDFLTSLESWPDQSDPDVQRERQKIGQELARRQKEGPRQKGRQDHPRDAA